MDKRPWRFERDGDLFELADCEASYTLRCFDSIDWYDRFTDLQLKAGTKYQVDPTSKETGIIWYVG